MYDTDIINVGEKLKKYRNARNMSMQELGDAVGKSKSTINRYETGEILMDILTVIEICNVLNIDINDLCEISVQSTEENKNINPFDYKLLYLYYISKGGIVISSIEIEEKKYTNYVSMKNGLVNNKYKQEYVGVMESNYNTSFICLTNAINNPGLDKFQIEIDLHSKVNNMYYGLFLGISNNTHRPTSRKCILTRELIKSKEKLNELFEELKVSENEIENIIETKYWDMPKSQSYVINL